ncbi:MAG: glycosyltransferase [Methylobacter sp.]|nr:glycosyltransferase [Methylobacter sp.]
MKRSLLFICNALDDVTRLERGIVTDSPAASHKIFLITKAMQKAGVRAFLLSLGRGRQNGTGHYFRCKVLRVDGVPVIYLPFMHFPILSELLSLFSSIPVIWRMRLRKGKRTVLFYNRMPVYLAALAVAKILGFATFLDLEDGETDLKHGSLAGAKSRMLSRLYDTFCPEGALLACEALNDMTRIRPTQCCYGISENLPVKTDWSLSTITVLFGGTISEETGAPLLKNAINLLRDESSSWAKTIRFEITGKGNSLEAFKALAEDPRKPDVMVHGRTTDNDYLQILARTQVGLSLKPNEGKLADTTFPSKVIEFASHGILVVTTDISDVRKVLGEGSVYLDTDNPKELLKQLRWIVENRAAARDLSLKGVQAVSALCASEIVGLKLGRFLFESSAGMRS